MSLTVPDYARPRDTLGPGIFAGAHRVRRCGDLTVDRHRNYGAGFALLSPVELAVADTVSPVQSPVRRVITRIT